MAEDSAKAAQISFWGVQVSVTVKLEPPERVQVGLRELPSVGEGIGQLGAAEVDDCATLPALRLRGARPPAIPC